MSKQPRKQRLARHTAPLHRRHREMAAPLDRGLRRRQEERGYIYPRSIPVRTGDRVLIVRGEGRGSEGHRISQVDRRARKIYVDGFTYHKSDGTELQRPIDPSNLVVINPDWSDVRRRRILDRANEGVEWTDETVAELEAAEDEYEAEVTGVDPREVDAEADTEGDSGKDDVRDWSALTVSELKGELKERGLPISGKKAELVARLEESE
ncbi:MAG: 50S ribosomal protein L24 [Candidatus Poseidoniia archaeon]|jgi:large subunit ribosomal protein L24|nr:50S ribosomal protein L24 [Euryarchaeota archaeon]MDP6489465.1 50S ribosomal protein L24 [Candidatus Poseidoniia archaeon]MDP6534155.1 50S ribosomal protein L24 [Candidatus Poseidoniia archaeon]HIH79272.1 50S ribosomal protein L24 [Candidatus Poseidoniia archaeon]